MRSRLVAVAVAVAVVVAIHCLMLLTDNFNCVLLEVHDE
jgi:hypothetical protein